MDQDSHPAEQEQAPPEQLPVTSEEEVPHPPVAEKQPEASHRNTDDAAERAVLQSLQRSTVRSNWVIAVATVINLFVAFLQRGAMEDANERADQAIEKADIANKIALNALIASQRQAEGGERQAEIERREEAERAKIELEESRRQSETSQGLTRQTIEDSRRAFEVANRARLGVEDVSNVRLQAGVVFLAYVTIRNTGKVPAKNVAHRGRMEIRNRPLPEGYVRAFAGESDFRVDTGDGLSFIVEARFPELDKKTVEEIKSGRTPLYFFGRASYDDGFGQQRTLGFCNLYTDREPRPWTLCRDQNWAE